MYNDYYQNMFTDYQKFLQDVVTAANDEAQAGYFYTVLMEQAPTEFDKEQIRHARDDERKHLCQLRKLYYSLTGEYPVVKEPVPVETTYQEGLKKAFEDELGAAEFYRSMMLSARDMRIRDVLFEIMTDEMEHATRFAFIRPR